MATMRIWTPIWKVMLTIFNNREHCNQYRQKLGFAPMHKDAYANCSLITFNSGDQELIMFLPEDATDGTIAHECLHATLFILECRGVVTTADNAEPATYLLAYLVNQIHKRRSHVRKRNRKRVRKSR